ncbi:MAG: hypothetical protein ABH806_03360 [Candidatus Omnitrophota bacterium]
MEKKRSKGVLIFAWLMIIVNAYALLSSLNFQRNFFDIYLSFPKGLNIVLIAYSILASVIGVIAGFGILKLKEIMRRISVVINGVDILVGLPVLLFSLNDIREYTYSVAASLAATDPMMPVYTLASVSFYTTVLLIMFSYCFNLLLIFFFTRPKVKEQFK